ncbi:FecCD family ABC transporter permease [Herpetosiphon sp. NSE202]|uniref:FecCD family ABC transporter permease n=1 Tax=Herpetosiphon sp. NSE202 TaxID=3351349 RepID=UPI0036392582
MTTTQRDHQLPTSDPRSWLIRTFPLALFIGLVVIVGLLIVHIVVGTVELTPRQILAALLNQADDPLHRQVIWSLRMPRALVALVAGGMLGLAGAILQAVTRNPLADPGLLGVSSGGVLAVTLWIAIAAQVSDAESLPDSGLILPILALIGGLTTASLVYTLSRQRGTTNMVRLVLTGVLVGGLCSAMTSLLLLWASEYNVQRMLRWTIGSTAGRVWVHWHTLWPAALLALPLGLACAGIANGLQLGDEMAISLGIRVERGRAMLLFAAALLTAGAVAVVGNVGFIGLVGPHMARRLAGSDGRRLFPLSVLLSGMLLLLADILARTLSLDWLGRLTNLPIPEGAGLPVGVITALLGAPFFLYLLLRQQK